MKGNIQIKAAKLVTPKGKDKSGWWLDVSLEETINGKKHTDDKECQNNPHEDLINAFSKLGKHIAALTCQYDDKGELDTANIEARGYSLKGEEEKEGITMTGQRTVLMNRSVTLNTPFLNWQRTDDYPDMEALSKLIDKCNEEVMAYMFEDKFFVVNQMSLGLDEVPQVDTRKMELVNMGFQKVDNKYKYDELEVDVVDIEILSDKDWKALIKKLTKKIAA